MKLQGFKKDVMFEPRLSWEDNIKKDLHEVGCVGMDWIELAQECGNESSGSIKCGKCLDYLNRLASEEGLYSML
jgi:hypothetical protein